MNFLEYLKFRLWNSTVFSEEAAQAHLSLSLRLSLLVVTLLQSCHRWQILTEVYPLWDCRCLQVLHSFHKKELHKTRCQVGAILTHANMRRITDVNAKDMKTA